MLIGVHTKDSMEFLDGWKPYHPIEKLSEYRQRAVKSVVGILTVGNSTEICLSNHINRPEKQE